MLRNEIKAMIGKKNAEEASKQARVWSILQGVDAQCGHGWRPWQSVMASSRFRTVPRANRRIETLAQPITSKRLTPERARQGCLRIAHSNVI